MTRGYLAHWISGALAVQHVHNKDNANIFSLCCNLCCTPGMGSQREGLTELGHRLVLNVLLCHSTWTWRLQEDTNLFLLRFPPKSLTQSSCLPTCLLCWLMEYTCWRFLLVLLPFLPLVQLFECLCRFLKPSDKHLNVIQGAVQDLLWMEQRNKNAEPRAKEQLLYQTYEPKHWSITSTRTSVPASSDHFRRAPGGAVYQGMK